jgi:PAS domain S-box-containing protein
VFVMNAQGTVVCPSRTNSYADREWFQRAMATRRAVLGDFQISRFFGTPDVVMALPDVDPNGSVRFVYAAAIDLRELARTAELTRLPPMSTMTLLDRHRTILVRFPHGEEWIGKAAPISGAIDRLASGAAEDLREDVGIDGIRRLWTTVPVDIGTDAGLVLGIGTPHTVAFAAADDLLRRSALLLAIVVAATMTIGWLAAGAFVLRPMSALSTVVRRLADGDLTARAQLATAVPGLREVTESVNLMAEALEARQRDQQQLRLLGRAIESTNDLVSVTDVQDRFTFVNRAFLDAYGYELDEVIGRTPAMLRPADRTADVDRAIRAQTEAGGWHGRLANRRKDGTEVFIQLDTSTIRDDGGELVGLLAIARDVSEERQSEQKLREIEERMRFALDSSNVGVWEGNLKTGEYFWSDIQERLHGIPVGSFAGTMAAFFGCVHPDDRDRLRRTLLDASSAGRDVEFEYRVIWPDRTEHWIRSSAHYVMDAGESVRGAGIAVDITDRRTLEMQLQHAQKLEAIGKLAGGIAHDFNNMLTAIIGNAEVLRDDLAPADAHRRVVDQILRAGRRSAELTHQLLAFSRTQILAPRILQTSDVVSSVTPMLRRLLGEQIELRAIVGARRSVKADAGQLEQVLVNLAVNARDAMPDGGVLTIETSDVVVSAGEREQEMVAAGSYSVISVRDTGSGMDASTQSRVFEPFFTTKAPGRGTGLGLATVYGIVKQSGGHVFLSSEVGRGSCFKVYLPHTTESEPEADHVPPAPPRPAGGRETVLLVEDEPAVREFVMDVLERAGYSVHTAPTGTDAVAFVRGYAGAIDLLLTDVVLPDVSGRMTAEQIRSLHPEAGILYMSGYTDDVIVHDGVLDEGTDFLAKPFTIDALLTRVRQSLSSGSMR